MIKKIIICLLVSTAMQAAEMPYDLYSLIEKNDIESFKRLLTCESDVDINRKNEKGFTALHLAAMSGKIEFAKYLIVYAGADIHIISGFEEWSDLSKWINRVEIIKWYNFTALQLAAMKGHLEIVQCLSENGAMLNSLTKSGAESLLHLAVKYKHLHIAKFLVEQRVDIDARDVFQETPLHKAAFSGHDVIVDFLIAHGADVNAQSSDGWRPVHSAAQNGYFNILKLLVKQGAELHVKNAFGCNAIYYAALYGSVEMVRFLKNHGASIDVLTLQGETLFSLAIAGNNKKMALWLISHGCSVTNVSAENFAELSQKFRDWQINLNLD